MKRLGLVLTAPLLVLALASCGGSADSGGGRHGVASAGGDGGTVAPTAGATGEPPSDDPDERRLQLTQCLRDNGLDVDDIDPNGGMPTAARAFSTADPETREAAFEACRQYTAGDDAHSGMSEEDKAQVLEYIQCLRKEGIDVSDPDPETGRPQLKDLQKFMNPDEETKQAMEACEDLRQGLFGGRGANR